MEKRIGTLIKVLPIKRQLDNNVEYDSLLLWYRDENGIKQTEYVDRCEVPYYILKDKTSKEALTPPMFIEKDKVEKCIVYSDLLFREIAAKTDSMSYFDRVRMNWGDKSSNMKNLLKHNWIYDADMDVTDRYIKQFHERFDPNISYKLHKCFMDIEVDLAPNGLRKDAKGHVGYMGFPDENIAPCPISIITLFDSKSLISYSFICRNSLNQSLKDFERVSSAKKEEFKLKILERHGILPSDVRFEFFNSEEETIEAYFRTLHMIDPDIIAGWNIGFDYLTMLNRLQQLYNRKKELKAAGIRGYDQMLTTVCDQKYMFIKDKNGEDVYLSPKAYYKQHKEKAIVDRMDEFTCLDGIVLLDTMLLYANIRKATVKESYALDAIAYDELGSEKLDYTGYTLKTLPWKNYELYALYNIVDVVLLKCLEDKLLDIDLVQTLSDVTNTRKYKVFKKTISIKNFVNKFAEEQGFIMGNNKNAQYGNDSEFFETNYLNKKDINEFDPKYLEAFNKKENFGAYVGDPALNDYCGIKDASGKPSMYLFENVFDEDFSSLYPSIIRAYNLDKNTQVGKFFLLDQHIKQKLIDKYGYDGLFAISKNDEAEGEESTSDVGPTLIDSLISHDWSRIGEEYFDLPSSVELINELKNNRK